MCVTTADEALMCALGIDPGTELDLDSAGTIVDAVLAALAERAVALRAGDVRVHGTSATAEQRRALFELIATGWARKGRSAVRLTHRGRAAARAEGVACHVR